MPQDYIGPVYIIYDQKYGKKPGYRGTRAIEYDIPPSGILLTQQYFKSGTYSDKNILFYYRDSLGNFDQLYLKKPGDFSADSVVIFPFSMSSRMIDSVEFKHVMEFYVGVPKTFSRDSIKELKLEDIRKWKE